MEHRRDRFVGRRLSALVMVVCLAAALVGSAAPTTVVAADAASSAPSVSGAHPVSDPVPGLSAPSAQFEPKVAFDGTNYLVVWLDGRRGSDIYGARISRAGAVLDPSGIVISSDLDAFQQSPSVAFDGTNFLVVWTRRDLPTGVNELRGTRITTSGAVLDRPELRIRTVLGEPAPALAFDGTNYLVTWAENRSGTDTDIFGVRVGRDGADRDATPITISHGARNQETPSVAFDGTNYLVTWTDWRNDVHGDRVNADIFASRVSRAGVALDPTGIAVSTHGSSQFEPALAFDGTNYLVVWGDSRVGESDIYGTRVTRAGAVLNSAGNPISTAARAQFGASVAFDGTNYLVVWTDLRPSGTGPDRADVFGTRVAKTGAVLEPSGFDVSPGAATDDPYHGTALGLDGTRFLALWAAPNISDVVGARVTKAGGVLETAPIIISRAADEQRKPAVAFDGTNDFVVWTDIRSENQEDIRGGRVGPGGSILDGQGIAISTAANRQLAPAIAFDGTNYLVVWTDSRASATSSDIYGARVSKDGTVLDPAGLAISTAPRLQAEPKVAFDGTNYLVTWTDLRNDDDPELDNQDVYGARVSRAGVVLDPSGIPISTAVEDQSQAALAFDGTNYLVVWTDRRNNFHAAIYGTRVSRAGGVLDPSGIPVSTGDEQREPAVAFDGTNYLVVWTDYGPTADRSDVVGARVSRGGLVRAPGTFPISNGAGGQRLPQVAYNGSFLVVWRDDRTGFADVFGGRVTTAGARLDGNGFPIARTLNFTDIAVAGVAPGPGGDRHFAVVYASFVPESPYGTSRVFLRTSPK
jgi:hypothetical protein